MTPAGWLALSAERDTQLALRDRAWRQAYRAGYEHGWRAGYLAACAEQAESWGRVAPRFARPGPSRDELELRRWGPGGRAHFGDRRPGDFPGRGDGP